MVATLHSSACRSRQQHCSKLQATYLGDMSERVRHSKGRYNSCSTGLQVRQTITRRSHKATTSARRSSSFTPWLRSGYAKGVLAALSTPRTTRGQDRSSRRRSASTGRAWRRLLMNFLAELFFFSGWLATAFWASGIPTGIGIWWRREDVQHSFAGSCITRIGV
jgi:hypothetical protein